MSTPARFSCSFVDSHWILLHIWVVFLENWPMVCAFLFSRIKCTKGFHYEEGDSSHTAPYRHTYRWEFALQVTLLNWDLIQTLNCMLLKGHHKGHNVFFLSYLPAHEVAQYFDVKHPDASKLTSVILNTSVNDKASLSSHRSTPDNSYPSSFRARPGCGM